MTREHVGTCTTCLPLESRKEIAARTGKSLRQVGASLERTWDDNGDPSWRCNNCGGHMPRRIKTRAPGRTAQQQSVLDRFPQAALKHAACGDEANYEVKSLEITDRDHVVYLRLEVGRTGDEGTLASIFCRSRWSIVVGQGGGVSPLYWGGTKSTKPRGFWNVIRQCDTEANRRIARHEARTGEDLPRAQQAVFALLRDATEPMSTKALATALGRHPSSVRQALHRLHRANRITRTHDDHNGAAHFAVVTK